MRKRMSDWDQTVIVTWTSKGEKNRLYFSLSIILWRSSSPAPIVILGQKFIATFPFKREQVKQVPYQVQSSVSWAVPFSTDSLQNAVVFRPSLNSCPTNCYFLASLLQNPSLGIKRTCVAIWSLLSFPTSELLGPNLSACGYVRFPRKQMGI